MPISIQTIKNKKFVVVVASLLFVAVLMGGYFFITQRGGLFGGKPASPAQFVLTPVMADAAGIAPETSFILRTNQALSANDVKKILKFQPQIDFKVKKTAVKVSWLATAWAQETATTSDEEMKVAFEITPEQALATDTIYQVAINDADYVDREYQWAFQVKAPFQVISVLPGDKSAAATTNSTIEIIFNRENLISPENYFEITPKVEGGFEQRGETLIFQPKKLDPETIYNVLIKKGLKVADSDDVLADDYSFIFETGAASADYQRSVSFGFQESWPEFQPNQNIIFGVWTDNIDLASSKAEVYRFSNDQEFVESYAKTTEFSWAQFSRRKALAAYQPPASQLVFSFQPQITKSQYQQFLQLPQKLESGYYFLRVRNVKQNIYEGVWFQVSPLSHYFSITHNKGLIWLYDFVSKKPVSSAQVSVYGHNQTENVLGATNQGGLLNFATPANLQAENENDFPGPQFFRVEKSGYLPVIIMAGGGWPSKAQSGSSFWSYLSTNKPLYKPSDTLKFWGVAKSRTGNDIKEKKIEVGIYDGYYYGYGFDTGIDENKFLAKQEVTVSAFNTIEGAISFQGLAPGSYNLIARSGHEIISNASVQVLTYVKPAYEIIVEPDRPEIYAGQPVKFKVKARFFDGTPVAFLHLKYSSYWQNQQISDVVKLNEKGEGEVAYTPQYSELSSYYSYWPTSFSLSFSPLLAEEGEISGEGQVLVFGPNLYLQVFQEEISMYNFQFTAKLNYIDINQLSGGSEYIGQPAVGKALQAQLVKITYRKIIQSQTYDPIYKVMNDNYTYQPEEEIMETSQGVSNAQGEWVFSKNISLSDNSYYAMRFSGQDSQGRNIQDTVYVYSFYGGLTGSAKLNINLEINGEQYRKEMVVSQKIDIKAHLSGQEPTIYSPILFYRWQNDIDEVVLSDNKELAETFSFNFLPAVRFRAVALGPDGFVESSDAVAVLKTDTQGLNIDIATDKEKYRPQDTVKMNLKVRDKNNIPTSAALNVAVVDEAMFHILSDSQSRPNILDDLFSEIAISPMTGASFYNPTASAGAEMGGCFGAGTEILMADGQSKPIEKVRAGDKVLTLADSHDGDLLEAIVQGISSHQVDDYLLINNYLAITAEHKMWVNGQWQMAGEIKVGDTLLNYQGGREKISAIKVVQQKVPVYNIVVGKQHTYFAGRVYVHNEEKGGGARNEFLDAILFESLNTDFKGEANLSFKVPDNLTSWRATVLAFSSSELKAGQADKALPVSLPFFIDATLNELYLKGDQPVLKMRLFGDGYQINQPVSLEIKSDSLGLNTKMETSSGQADLNLPALPIGEQEITISAKQGELSDVLVKKIKVVDSYFRRIKTEYYNLSDGLSGVAGNSAGLTKLYFVEAGAGKFYQTLQNAELNSGIRLDQQAAGFMAQKLLNQRFGEPLIADAPELNNYYKEDGGLALLSYGGSDLALSAKIADLLAGFVYKEKSRGYFQDALSDKKSDLSRVSQALYGLSSLGDKTLNKINLVKKESGLTFEDKIYLALALAKVGDKEGAREIYYSSLRPSLQFQGQEAWLSQEKDQTKQVKNTALLAVLASYLNVAEDSKAIWQYVAGHSPLNDLKTLEEMLFIKSELSKAGQIADKPSQFSLSTNQRQVVVDLAKEKFHALSLPANELSSLRFSNIKGEIDLVATFEQSARPEDLIKHNEISVRRVYVNQKNSNQPADTFNDGDIVELRLYPTFAYSSIDGPYQLIDYLPSGLKPITKLYEVGLWSASPCDYASYPWLIVDNAIYFVIDKESFQGKYCFSDYIKYYARVADRGKYTANPALLQSLKDTNFLNVSEPQAIHIK